MNCTKNGIMNEFELVRYFHELFGIVDVGGKELRNPEPRRIQLLLEAIVKSFGFEWNFDPYRWSNPSERRFQYVLYLNERLLQLCADYGWSQYSPQDSIIWLDLILKPSRMPLLQGLSYLCHLKKEFHKFQVDMSSMYSHYNNEINSLNETSQYLRKLTDQSSNDDGEFQHVLTLYNQIKIDMNEMKQIESEIKYVQDQICTLLEKFIF